MKTFCSISDDYTYNGLIVEFKSDEFTAICPFDKKPDMYTLTIIYVSSGLCVESDSLNNWLLGFRDKSLSAEELTGVIANEINDLLNPHKITVILKQSIRSSLQLTTKKEIDNVHNSIPSGNYTG